VKNKFFETIKVLDGQIFHLQYHQKRYESVLQSLGIFAYENLYEHLHVASKGLYRCKIIYDEHSLEVSYFEYTKREIQSLKLVYDNDINYEQKSTDRERLDALYALRQECSEVLIVKHGLITDTSIANIALYKKGVWYTPKTPLLKGTTRARLLKEKKIIEKDIYEKDLKEYTGVALLNAMVEFDIITLENAGRIIC
jgi:4-amino-4-deoxychorismate lyase